MARTVSVAAGTALPIRLADSLDSGTTQTGQAIHGTLTADIIADNMVAIPRGTPVVGRVIQAKDATHFAGSSLLSIELTQVELKGRPLSVVTTPFSQQGKGRGKNTAIKTGGGAAIGAIIGALAGGGKGAAIGAASGGGLGAGVNAVTRGRPGEDSCRDADHLQTAVADQRDHDARGKRAGRRNLRRERGRSGPAAVRSALRSDRLQTQQAAGKPAACFFAQRPDYWTVTFTVEVWVVVPLVAVTVTV